MALIKRTNRDQNSQLVGDNFTNVPSNTTFSLGDFRVESNFTGRQTKDYSNELSSFVKPITLETLSLTQTQSDALDIFTNNATLNLDRSDLRSYAKFGSAQESMRVAIQNVVLQYPASLFVSNQVNTGGNVTVVNYVYDADSDTSTFNVPAVYTVNKFGLIFNDGNNEIIDGNELKNLNISYYKYVIWRKDKPEQNAYDILEFVGDSTTNPFVSVLVKGNPFPEASGGTTNIPYHLKPNPEEYNLFKARLSTLESYLIKERLTGQTGFKTTLKNIVDFDTGVQFIDKEYIWPTSDGYNVDFSNAVFDAYQTALLNLGLSYDNLKTDLIYRFLTPESIKMFDNTDEGKMGKMLRIYGKEIDDTRLFIDSLVNVNKVTYNKKNNIPDQLVKNLAKALGWDVFALLEEEQFMDEITALTDIEKEENDLLPPEIDIELWRRILINTNYYWKSKGTRHALKSILLLIGIPEPFVNITEYVYTVDGKINPDEVTLTLADLPSASLPYNSQGYPIAVAETDDMFFQLSGNNDSGQAYIDLYRAVGFDVNRTVDNKKTWVETGYTERSHYTTPNYIQQDSKLIINTKEIDVTLDTARAIEYDVWRYIKEIDFPINSSGYTKPYTFVNIGIGYDAPETSFSVPHDPLGAIQFNFNGIVLTPSGATEPIYFDYYQSGKTVTINPLSGVQAKQYPSGEKDVITLTYLYNRLGIPTVGEIKYVVYRVSPSDITSAGARITLADEPRGEVQLSINGTSLSYGGNSYVGDYIQDPNDPKTLVIQNSDVILYIQSNPAVVVSYIVNTTDISVEKKSEFYRVDGFNTSKLYYCAPINKVVYRLNFAMLDIEDVKFMVNGITLQPHTDYQINPNNPYEIYLPPNINLGDVLGAYYLIDPSNTSTPIISDTFGLGDISNLTFLEFVELVQRKLVNAKSRKIITDFRGGYYPTLMWVYVEYLRRACLDDDNPLKTNGYTFGNLYPFISKYNAFFERFVKQLLPATIILRKGGILIRNTIFTKQKFTYKRGVSFDPELAWYGDDGSEFKYRLPSIGAEWEDEFVCEVEDNPCTDFGFVGTPSVLCDGETTTTSTTTTTTTTSTTTTLPPQPVVTLFAVGDEFITKSTDSGVTWTQSYSADTFLNSVTFLDADNGWAFGGSNPAKAYKTTNGGSFWYQDFSLPAIVNSRALYGATQELSDTIYVGGNLSTFIKYNGSTWSDESKGTSHNAYDLYAFNSNTALSVTSLSASANYLLRTTNGGTSWSEPATTPVDRTLTGIDFRKEGGAGVGMMISSKNATTNKLFRTTDSGQTWSTISATAFGTDAMQDISFAFTDSDTVYIVGDNQAATEGRVWKSTNAGLTWTDISGNLPASTKALRSVRFFTPDIGWAGADFGDVYYTTNGGTSWTQVDADVDNSRVDNIMMIVEYV